MLIGSLPQLASPVSADNIPVQHGANTYKINYSDLKGEKGDTGATGNGISSVVLNNDYTLTINFTDGTSTTTTSIRGATGAQGPQGETGPQGATGNGISTVAKTGTSGLVDTYTITFTDGTTTTFTVTNGSDATVTVDTAMSSSSTNPVQNKVIYGALTSGTQANKAYHLGFYLDANGDLCYD